MSICVYPDSPQMSSEADSGGPGLVGGGRALGLWRRDANGVENFLQPGELLTGVDMLDVARRAVADGSYAVADFVAGFIGVSMQIDAGVLVHAGGGPFFHPVKRNAVHGTREVRAAEFPTDVEFRAGFGVRSVKRADGEEFVHKVGARVHAGPRLDGSESDAALLREMHGNGAEIAQAAIHVRQFTFFEQIAIGCVKGHAVFLVGKLP